VTTSASLLIGLRDCVGLSLIEMGNYTIGDVQVPAGAIMLHQILNTNQFNGSGHRVFRQFISEVVELSGGDLYLTVRRENGIACRFYERHGMQIVGTVAWKLGAVAGLVYRLSKPQRSNRIHAAAKQPVPMATPMAGTRNQ
jgi:hypothetical protein